MSWQEHVNFQWDHNEFRFVLDQRAQWNNNPPVDMSPHSDTLFWFRANQSLLFLINAVCLSEKQQIVKLVYEGH